MRDGEVRYLVWLITRRSRVRIPLPLRWLPRSSRSGSVLPPFRAGITPFYSRERLDGPVTREQYMDDPCSLASTGQTRELGYCSQRISGHPPIFIERHHVFNGL